VKLYPIERKYILIKNDAEEGTFKNLKSLVNNYLIKEKLSETILDNLFDGKTANYELVGLKTDYSNIFNSKITFYYKDKNNINREYSSDLDLTSDLFMKSSIQSLKKEISSEIKNAKNLNNVKDKINKFIYVLDHPEEHRFIINGINYKFYEIMNFNSEKEMRNTLNNCLKIGIVYEPHSATVFAKEDLRIDYYLKSGNIIKKYVDKTGENALSIIL